MRVVIADIPVLQMHRDGGLQLGQIAVVEEDVAEHGRDVEQHAGDAEQGGADDDALYPARADHVEGEAARLAHGIPAPLVHLSEECRDHPPGPIQGLALQAC